MIICNNNSIDIIQGNISYGNAVEGITDWRLENTSSGVFNILNSTSTTPNISIIDNGNVGIGTVPTSSKLEIIGDINISGNYRKNNRDIISDTSNYVLSTNNILSTNLKEQWTNVSSAIYYTGISTNPNPNPITSSPAATATGITGNYTYMQFTYTGDTISGSGQTQYTITVPAGVICDILIVGGGGGGGNAIHNSSHEPGGGGAGGVVYMVNKSLSDGTYKINVGNGGAGNTNGNNSTITDNNNNTLTFDNILLVGKGGGKGATGNQTVGSDGGSGGGGGHDRANGGTATQGNTFWNGTTYIAGGNNGARPGGGSSGGGGGGAGEAGDADGGGFGGDGVQVSITGTNTFYAGGGNAYYNTSTIRSDGGGGTLNGTGSQQNGGSALPNTGSGGSGAYTTSSSTTGGSGGSGIVIIRYLYTTNVGIGTTNPISKLHLFDNTINETKLTILNSYSYAVGTEILSSIELIRGSVNDSNRDYKIGNYNGDFIVKSSINGTDNDNIKITGATNSITNPTGTTTWTTASDRRIKENIERASYDKCYESINKLELNRFNYINGFNTVNKDITQLGFIAQEVKEIFPKSVFENSYINNNINISDLQSIDITQINYTLYGAVKKLIEIINDDEEKIKKLESILNIDTSSTSNIDIDTSSTSNIDITSTSNIDITSTSNIDTISTSNIDIDNMLTSNIDRSLTSNIDTSSTSNIDIDNTLTSNNII